MRFPCLSIPGDLFTDGLDFHVGLIGCQNELKDPTEVVLEILYHVCPSFFFSTDASTIALWPTSTLHCVF